MAKAEAATSSPKTTRTTKAEQREVEQSETLSDAKKVLLMSNLYINMLVVSSLQK